MSHDEAVWEGALEAAVAALKPLADENRDHSAAEAAIRAWLDHLDNHYIGDQGVEQSFGYLRTKVGPQVGPARS